MSHILALAPLNFRTPFEAILHPSTKMLMAHEGLKSFLASRKKQANLLSISFLKHINNVWQKKKRRSISTTLFNSICFSTPLLVYCNWLRVTLWSWSVHLVTVVLSLNVIKNYLENLKRRLYIFKIYFILFLFSYGDYCPRMMWWWHTCHVSICCRGSTCVKWCGTSNKKVNGNRSIWSDFATSYSIWQN